MESGTVASPSSSLNNSRTFAFTASFLVHLKSAMASVLVSVNVTADPGVVQEAQRNEFAEGVVVRNESRCSPETKANVFGLELDVPLPLSEGLQ